MLGKVIYRDRTGLELSFKIKKYVKSKQDDRPECSKTAFIRHIKTTQHVCTVILMKSLMPCRCPCLKLKQNGQEKSGWYLPKPEGLIPGRRSKQQCDE